MSNSSLRSWALEHGSEVVLMISTTLSIIGCLIIIITYAVYKDIRSSSRHIIVCISIADLIVSSANLVADFLPPTNINACILQSFIGSTALSWSFMWTVSLAVFLYILIVLERPSTATALIHPWFHLLCWLVPLIINVCALLLKKLGNNRDLAVSGWCWIEIPANDSYDRNRITMWMFVDGKGLEMLTYFIILVLYIRIKIHLRKQIYHFERKQSFNTGAISSLTLPAARSIDQKLILIPVIYILLRMWGTIRFFLLITSNDGKHQLPFLIIMQALGDNLVGACNCVFFCFLTPKVWNHIKNSASTFRRRCLGGAGGEEGAVSENTHLINSRP